MDTAEHLDSCAVADPYVHLHPLDLVNPDQMMSLQGTSAGGGNRS